jgi:hypothetical protein
MNEGGPFDGLGERCIALDSHGGSLKAHPVQIKPPSFFACRARADQLPQARRSNRSYYLGRKSFQHELLGKSGPRARAANLQPLAVPTVTPLRKGDAARLETHNTS